MSVEGHSGFARKGSDIVCAGVSALCASLAAGLERLEERGKISAFEYRISSGCFFCVFKDGEEGCGNGLFESACLGLVMISDAYPGYVGISEYVSP